MPELTGDLIRLSKDQICATSEMFTRAFFDDPKLTYLIPDAEIRKERARFLFEFELRYGMIYGDV